MNAFNVTIARSRPLVSVWGEFVAIVETRGDCEEMVERGCKEKSEPYSYFRLDRPTPTNLGPEFLFMF